MKKYLLAGLLVGLFWSCETKKTESSVSASKLASPTAAEATGAPISAKQAWEEISLLSATLQKEIRGEKAYRLLNETSGDTSVFHKRFKVKLAELRDFYQGQRNLVVYPVFTSLEAPLEFIFGTTGEADTLNASYFGKVTADEASLYKENFRYQLISTGVEKLLLPPDFYRNYFYCSIPTPIAGLEEWLKSLFGTGPYPEFIYLSPAMRKTDAGEAHLTIIYSVHSSKSSNTEKSSSDEYYNLGKLCPPPNTCQ